MKDSDFIRGSNPMTKMEVRSVIISYLDVKNGNRILDLGAGTGSVIIQLKKTFPSIDAIAIEKTDTGCHLIQENAKRHNVEVRIIKAEAPYLELDQQLIFDRVYIGGTGHQFREIMSWLESRHLKPDSILVFSVLTLESQQEILSYLFDRPEMFREIEASYIQASRMETLSDYHYFKPLNPCIVIKCIFGGHYV